MSPRPRKYRTIAQHPVATFYKPQGAPLGALQSATLSVEGLEALRLADAEGQDQASAARAMDVSPATFCRILAEARAVVARALSNGWAIRIEGGAYRLAEAAAPGAQERPWGGGRGGGRGRGLGRRRGWADDAPPDQTPTDKED
ncbi:protein of unknown function DUF134 [Desulfarculus baarsii DSM 2075]|uniref:UPF0251 protein Deba_0323 n=1 Tax=Desulfarculus baarsii (strain ATCC 33931 / DSM 2075 / LMG 7858 / VKM B-1802 / 2st14) TaxID=644282 RepID=E1QDR3_DESB2|nr:DUF134 domain-containing protein [Desulfarculus baarsii]ADK83699.1 protein of unknown function DUF134 [Desulfarculus baarsii DSM 2075]